MFRKLRRLKPQPLKNDWVNVRGCAFVCARACIYFFPKVEPYFPKYCYMGEAKAAARTYCAFLWGSHYCLCFLLSSFLKWLGYHWSLCYALLNECQPYGNHGSPCLWVTLVPVLFGAVVTVSRVKVSVHMQKRGSRDFIIPPVTGGGLRISTITGLMGTDRWQGNTSLLVYLAQSLCPRLLPSHPLGRGD